MYQAKFDKARDRYSKLAFVSFAEKERSSKIHDSIATNESQYRNVMSRIELYLHSRWTAAACQFPLSGLSDPRYAELASLSAQDYVIQVRKLVQVAPVSENTRNLVFHAQLLTGDYSGLESLGDHLLGGSGSIRIPFFAADRFFQLVIDKQKGRFYTEADMHPFEQDAREEAWLKSHKYWSDLEPFDLPFAEIKGLSQKAVGRWQGRQLDKNSYALKLEPKGLAPNYSLMNILFCSAGEKAEVTVTRNLGQFILHVIGSSVTVNADLADPSKIKGPSGSNGWVTGILIAGASMSSNTALGSMAIQGLQANQAQLMANEDVQQAAWDNFVAARDAFIFVEADSFTGLEELLGVVN